MFVIPCLSFLILLDYAGMHASNHTEVKLYAEITRRAGRRIPAPAGEN